MQKRIFKPFGSVSALTLGGGGIGNVWGETSREECVASVNLALESGFDHLDVAPMYGKGEAERATEREARRSISKRPRAKQFRTSQAKQS